MSPRERVLATFERKRTDKVPIHNIGFSSYAASVILGRDAYVGGGMQQWREAKALWEGKDAHQEYLERSQKDAFDLSIALEHDILRLEYWRMAEKPSKKINDNTFLYGDTEKSWRLMRFDPPTELYQVIDQYPPKVEDTIENIERSIIAQEKSLENYHPSAEGSSYTKSQMEKYGKNWVIRVGGGGLGIPYGSRIWLEMVALRPDLIGRYLAVQAEMSVRSMEGIANTGVQMIFGGGDFASNQGPFYSPKSFHELMLPNLRKISEECHKYGIYYLFASDGNLWPVADDLFGNSGVDGFYEIDGKAGMDLGKLREKFPHLTLIGNISSVTLHIGTKDDVINETLSCINEAKKSGGIIVGVSNAIVKGTPEENIWAMVETMKKYRG
ncbi:MAG: uroporphyrinogen decarboxylase family protein [Candidatus Poribacteria bacterium]